MKKFCAFPLAIICLLSYSATASTIPTCSELKEVLRSGSDYFRSISGSLIQNDILSARIRLSGAKRCFIDIENTEFDSKYICYFDDGSKGELPRLKSVVRALQKALDQCLTQKNIFKFSMNGRSMPRYKTPWFLSGSYDEEELELVWDDRYRFRQDISLALTQEENSIYTVRLSIPSR